jgi:type IX secretion system PorP/SprF family membrane protein
MNRLYSIIIFIGLSVVSQSLRAQDPAFSQYYSAPLYLNPAFTGTTQDHRFISNYRNQWPNLVHGYETYAFSYDFNLMQYHSGIGFMAVVDKAGTAGMKSAEFNFLYSYKWKVSDKWIISSGLNFGYATRSLDWNKLILGDQLQFDANGNGPTTDPAIQNSGMAHYFDFDAGILAYNKSFWFGMAASHMNQPNRSVIQAQETLPVLTTIHGGMRIPLSSGPFSRGKISVLSPSFVYKRQGKFDQLDVGAYFLYDPIVLGLWYRGIPIRQDVKNNLSQDAVVVMLGFNFEKFEVVYSYDFTVSELSPASGGTHEISLKYRIAINSSTRTKKKEKFIPCPSFMHKM